MVDVIAGVPMNEDYLVNTAKEEANSGSAFQPRNGILTKNGEYRNPFSDFWHDITGQSNSEATNSATYAMQLQAQKFNAGEALKQRDFEAQQAEIARQWQEQMSNTAVQRQAADLQAAGFNPWLAVNGSGASTGSVGIAYGDSASSAQGQAINATKSGAEMLAMAGLTAASIIKIIKMLK